MENRDKRDWIRQLALACFFVSGASGLMYEVAWNRMLGLVFGNTVFAAATVLTSFMAGLALGSFLAGRYADQVKRIIRFYAVLEIGIGIYCFFIPMLIKLAGNIYLPLQNSLQLSPYAFSLLRFVFCFILLLLPATIMGATTPVFSRFYVKQGERFGHGVGRAYAVNTFGAFIGVMVSGFFAIEHLGVRNTINVAVAGNIAAGVMCLLLDRFTVPSAEEKPKAKSARIRPDLHAGRRLVLSVLVAGLGVSGFAAMVYELAWTRTLAMIIGSSVYAFSIMLATFLVGLALGSFLFSIIARRFSINILWFALAQFLIGIAALVTMPLFEKMPFYFVSMFEIFGHNSIAMQLGRFALSSMVMFVPTILLGSLFPMVTQICTQEYSELGRKVGTIYSVNTLGNIGGSFMAGFVLIPAMGIQNSVALASVLNMAVGCIVIILHKKLAFRYRAMALSAAAVAGTLCVLIVPSWDKMVMSSGPSVYAPQYAEVERGDERRKGISGMGEEMLYYKEGIETTVAVRRRPKTGTVVMAVNGKVDASNTGDMYSQLMVAHIPLLISPDAKNAIVIGLGSGVTLGAAAQYPLEQIDCVEIDPVVVEASEFFRQENRNVLEDPRVNLMVTDGRNYLAMTPKKYDVIMSEPSNLWLAGTVNLFSLEFYQMCRERLTRDGVMLQWTHIYHMSPEDIKTVINTFRTVFPHTSIWFSVLGDIFMLATREELTIDYLQLAKSYNLPGVVNDLQALDIREPLALLSSFLLNESEVEKLVSGSRINTDDKPILAFSTPRNIYETTANTNHRLLLSFKGDVFPKMSNFNRQRVTGRASFWYHLAVAYESKDMPITAREQYEKAISVDKSFAPAYVGLALSMYKSGSSSDAIELLKKAVEIDPSGPEAHYNLAQIYYSQGRKDEARASYESAIKLSSQAWRYEQKFGKFLMESGDYLGAIQEYEYALRDGADEARNLHDMAKAYRALKMDKEAVEKLQQAISIDPNATPLYEELGDLYSEMKEYEKAIQIYRKIAELEPDSAWIHRELSDLYRLQGDPRNSRIEARKASERLKSPRKSGSANGRG